ncbi:hypothetical protein PMAYCL1PPCAC_09372 [Pristionchus mayeri]|uniref:Uncharacterized protein n=1 Tax=Pristionchus mayeri TaxID=1317129 RepID=A0AAN4ZJE1_9BILA|nr:hypothetical protein PMAYCL1PPCAC_09372 [Pristionchus mayeri]
MAFWSPTLVLISIPPSINSPSALRIPSDSIRIDTPSVPSIFLCIATPANASLVSQSINVFLLLVDVKPGQSYWPSMDTCRPPFPSAAQTATSLTILCHSSCTLSIATLPISLTTLRIERVEGRSIFSRFPQSLTL